MSGSEAILVLQKAREIAGAADFRDSRAYALRFAATRLDASITDARILLERVCPRERILMKLEDQPSHCRPGFQRRMVADFDAAVARLTDEVASRRRRIGVRAAVDADNWAGQSQAEKDRNWGRIFPQAVEAAKQEIPS